MPTLDATQYLIIDPVPLAEQIEAQLTEVLQPLEVGFYIPGQSYPVMRMDQFYYQFIGGKKIPVATQEDIVGDVFNEAGDVVVPAKYAKRITLQPVLPTRGLQIIRVFLQCMLDHLETWPAQGKRFAATYPDLFEQFIQPVVVEDDDKYSHVVELLLGMLSEIQDQVRQFVGKDRWVMHFVKDWGTSDFIIEKTIDYRIYDWQRKMTSGEWKP